MQRNVLWGVLIAILLIVIVAVIMQRQAAVETVVPEPTISFEEEAGPGQLENQVPITLVSPSVSPSSSETPSLSPSPSPKSASLTVTITDTDFSPASLTVPAGASVTFVNNGQGTHWPASDPHPTHTGLPGFDAKQGLATGDTYNFTFSQSGSWGYHDHLNPRLKGTIVVE